MSETVELKRTIAVSYQGGYGEYQKHKAFQSFSEDVPAGTDMRLVLAYQTGLGLLLKMEALYAQYLAGEFGKDAEESLNNFGAVLNQNAPLFQNLENQLEDLEGEFGNDEVFKRLDSVVDILAERHWAVVPD